MIERCTDTVTEEERHGTRKPKLLFLAQTLPYPPDGGVKIRTYNILRLLARSFDVTALCFYRWKRGLIDQDVEASVARLSELADVEAFPIPQEHGRARLFWDHFRSLATRRTYTVHTYEAAQFFRRLESLLATHDFDLVHADSLDLSYYFPACDGIPLVCVHHDVQSNLLRRRAALETRPWRRWYLNHQATLMEREERYWCPRVALNVTVSEDDKAKLEATAPGANVSVVPNGVDIEEFRPEPGGDGHIVFVGGTSWFPNRDALAYFRDSILPRLRAEGETTPVLWVGRATEHERKNYAAAGFDLTGYVPDIRPYVRDAACYIVPLRVGGGTRLKILDAWAMGKAVVSTSIGCEGLSAVDDVNILIRDTPAGFVRAVREVLSNRDLRRRLGQEGREVVERRYGWDAIGENMIKEYRRLLRDGTVLDTA